MKNILAAENVSAGYMSRAVLSDITLRVQKGEFIGIIGPNGSGKSTLLRAVSRVIRPLSGRVLLNGRDIYSLTLKEVARVCACVPQETTVDFPFTVMDVVLMGRAPHLGVFGREKREDFAAARRALDRTGTDHLEKKNINELSSGERQRVIIARALAQEPRLLLLDEATAHLDVGYVTEIFDLIESLHGQGMTVISVMHDLNLAATYCRRLILLDGGKIRAQGTPEEVLDYRILESVYRTCVVVRENPLTGKPYVVPVPGRLARAPYSSRSR